MDSNNIVHLPCLLSGKFFLSVFYSLFLYVVIFTDLISFSTLMLLVW